MALDAAALSSEIEALVADSSYEPGAKATLLELKREILAKLEERDRIARVASELEADIAAAPARLSEIERRSAQPPPPLPALKGLEREALQEGEAEARQALSSAESRLASLLEEDARRSRRRVELPEEIGVTHAATEMPSISLEVEGATAQAEAARLGTVTREVATVRGRLLAIERQHLEVTEQLIQAEIALARKEVDQLTGVLNAWVTAHEAVREEEAADLTTRARMLQERFADEDSEFGRFARENLRLAESRLMPDGIQARTAAAIQLVKKLERQVAELVERSTAAATRVRLLEEAGIAIDTATGNVLRRERSSLPSIGRLRADLREGIARATRSQIELIDFEEQLATTRQALAPEHPSELIETRRQILRALIDDYRRYVESLGIANGLRNQLAGDLSAYTRFIDERVLWIRNGSRVAGDDFVREFAGLRKIFGKEAMLDVVLGFREDLVNLPFLWLMLGALVGLFFYYRGRLITAIRETGDEASRENCTTVIPTLKAALYSLLVAVFLPLLCSFVAWRCRFGEYALKSGLMSLVLFLGLALLLFSFCRRGGLFERHLGFGKDRARIVRRRLRWFMPVMAAPVFFASALAVVEEEGTLGRIFYLISLAILAGFLGSVLRPKHRIVPAHTRFGWLPKIAFIAGISLPVGLALGVWLGYLSSVDLLSEHLLATFVAGLASLIVYAFFRRLLLVSRRHLAIQQAIERRDSRARERERRKELGEADSESDPLPSVEDVTARAIDITSVNQQAQWLLRTGMILVFALVLSAVWADLLPAFSALDRITLWGDESEAVARGLSADPSSPVLDRLGSGGGGEAGLSEEIRGGRRSVTLLSLVWSLFVFFLTLIFARNVPAFIKLAILPRLNLARGTGFAITTSVRYLIVIVGVIWAASEVGITWNSVQWIAAAITLGIGFGLQEVFANFVAGIILLFERPMRLGDYITIGELSGRVTRIEMRATTIRDFSHKELVIPNKEFITGQFVNWTLSDNVVRISIPVGVAYGSDIELVRSTLIDVAKADPRSLEEPPPQVVFLDFGASSLNFELRVHISGADEMVAIKSDFHFAIDKAFREADIVIAFPQLDLHVKSEG